MVTMNTKAKAMATKTKFVAVLAVLAIFCAFCAPAPTEASIAAKQGVVNGDRAAYRLALAHQEYHKGEACPNPQDCAFFKQAHSADIASKSSTQTSSNPQNTAAKRLIQAHQDFHKGEACPNPQECKFFEQAHPEVRNAGANHCGARRHVTHVAKGGNFGTRGVSIQKLVELHQEYHKGQACPDPKTCDFFTK